MAKSTKNHVIDDLSPKHDQAQALVRVVARGWIGYPATEVYRQLENQGWVWTGGGWYPRVEVKQSQENS